MGALAVLGQLGSGVRLVRIEYKPAMLLGGRGLHECLLPEVWFVWRGKRLLSVTGNEITARAYARAWGHGT